MTTKYFQIKTCPLCSKSLKIYFDGKVRKYYCPEFFFREADFNEWGGQGFDKFARKMREPHYSVIFEGSQFMQSTIIVPYWIKTVGGTDRTKIYKFPPKRKDYFQGLLGGSPGTQETDLIMEIPAIVPSDYLPADFAKKIKNLVIFL
jgi:hypothetical protein